MNSGDYIAVLSRLGVLIPAEVKAFCAVRGGQGVRQRAFFVVLKGRTEGSTLVL